MVMHTLRRENVVLFVAFWCTYALFASFNGWNENSRVSLTRALVDEGRIRIDTYQESTGDRAYYHGHYFSDKVPGLPVLAIPAYALYRMGHGYLPPQEMRVGPVGQKCTPRYAVLLWFLIALTVSPLVAAGNIVFRLLLLDLGFSRRSSLSFCLILGLATLQFNYGTIFFPHAVAGTFVLIAVWSIRRACQRASWKWTVLAAASSGLAVTSDLFAGIPIAGIGLWWLLPLWRVRLLPLFTVSLFLSFVPLGIYHQAAFGHPLDWGYTYVDTDLIEQGLMEDEIPMPDAMPLDVIGYMTNARPLAEKLDVAVRLLVFPYRGLLVYCPLLLLAWPGLWCMRIKHGREALWILSSFLIMLYLNSSMWYWWGGNCVGPRQLMCVLPLLMVAVAACRTPRWMIAILAVASWGIVMITLQDPEQMIWQSGASLAESRRLIISHVADRLAAFRPLAHPLTEYYWPLFIRQGPHSLLLQRMGFWTAAPFMNCGLAALVWSGLCWWLYQQRSDKTKHRL